MTSAIPSLAPYKVELSLGFVLLVTLANLRGVRESGTLFAIPTYAFIVSIFILVAAGMTRCIFGGCPVAYRLPPCRLPRAAAATGSVDLFVILHAFSSGSTALTGVEAISNGVPAFRRPQSKNASETLLIMGIISVTMFIGISYLATHIPGITVSEERSVVGQIAHAVFGGGFFYFVQFFTTAILVLAANTSYQDFPRLSSILARDRFMPRQFANRGDRLVFSNGVIVLGAFAGLLILVFDADLNRLIQLYVVGVFTSFTLSQTGMVRHWLKEKHKGEAAMKGWQRSIVINAIGAAATFLVLIIVTYYEVHRGRVDRDRRDADHRADVLLHPPPLHGDHGPAAARHHLARRLRCESRRPVGARPGAVHRRSARLPPIVPASRGARALPGRGGGRSAGGPGPLACVRRRRQRPGAAPDAGWRCPQGDTCVPAGAPREPNDFVTAHRARRRSRSRSATSCGAGAWCGWNGGRPP